MPVVKGIVQIRRPDGDVLVGTGRCVLLLGGPDGPARSGTVSVLRWESDPAAVGERYRVSFEDGRSLDVSCTRCVVTSCGPQIMRFTAAGPLRRGKWGPLHE